MAVRTTDLVAEWVAKLATGSGPGTNDPQVTTWVDNVGSFDGTLTGFGYTQSSGWAGAGTTGDPYCLVFSGDNDYVDCGDIGDGFSDYNFSIECWLSAGTPASNTGHPWSYKNTANDSTRLDLLIDPSAVERFYMYNDAGTSDYNTLELPTTGWHHVVCLMPIGDANGHVYVDGSLQASYVAMSGAMTLDKFLMGALWFIGPAVAQFYEGKLATVRAYSSAMSADEIAANYAAGVTAASTDSAGFAGMTVTRLLQG